MSTDLNKIEKELDEILEKLDSAENTLKQASENIKDIQSTNGNTDKERTTG